MELLIPIDCGGELFLIRMTQTKQGWTYAVPEHDITLGPLKEEPAKYHGELYLWFHEEVLGKLARKRTDADEIETWEQFCTSYERRTQSQLLGVEDIILGTDKVVSYSHEILEITIRGRTCRLEGADILNSKKFEVWHQFAFKSPINFKKNGWKNLMFAWMDMAEEGEVEEAAVRGIGTVEAVLNYLKTYPITRTKEEMENSPMLPFLDVDGLLLLSNTVLQETVKNDGISMRYLSSMLQPYLAGRSRPMRVGKGLVRFWVFDPAKVGIDIQTTLDEEIEEHEEN